MINIQRLSRDRRPNRWVVSFATVLLFASQHGHANWQVSPVLKAGVEVDDNATLAFRTDEEISFEGLLLEAGANFNFLSDRTDFTLAPRVRSNNYNDNTEFESTDVFLASQLRHQLQSGQFGFRMNYDRQTVRTAERANTELTDELEDIPGDDSGQVASDGTRDRFRFKPSWGYDLSNVTTIGAELEYIGVRYNDIPDGFLDDFDDVRLNLLYRRKVSDRTSALVRLSGRQYESDAEQPQDLTGYGGLVGFERALSPTTRLQALIGFEDSDVASAEPIANVTLVRRLETIDFRAQYRRALNSNGRGRVAARDQINVNFSRRLTEKLSAGLGVRAYRTQSLDSDDLITVGERDYVQLRSSFTWNFTRNLQFEADYRYTILDQSDEIGESSNSNRVTLWLIYQPRRQNARR